MWKLNARILISLYNPIYFQPRRLLKQTLISRYFKPTNRKILGHHQLKRRSGLSKTNSCFFSTIFSAETRKVDDWPAREKKNVAE